MVDIPLLLKRSSVDGSIPVSGDLQLGELALNTFNGILFFKNTSGQVKVIAANKTVKNIASLPYTIENEYTSNVKQTGTISLPASPDDGEIHVIRRDFETGDLIVDGNGNTINNESDVLIDTNLTALRFQFNANDNEWMII